MPNPRRRFLKSAASLAAGFTLPCDNDGPQVLEAAPADTVPREKGSPSLPIVPFGEHRITRLIVGANPFYGYSHFNRLFSTHMTEWATPERVCATLRQCEQNGINTWQLSYSERGISDLKRHRAEGGKLQWILLSSRELEEDPAILRAAAAHKPMGIVHHGGSADRRWRNGEIEKVHDFLKRVRDSGVMVGLSTHNPALMEHVEERNWDIDFYMTAMYQITRSPEEFQKILGQRPIGEVYLPEDPPRMCRMIRKTRRPCLCYKVLAAGRLADSAPQIDQAFRFAFENIKPQDAIIIGMYPRYTDQVRDNAERIRRILGKAG